MNCSRLSFRLAGLLSASIFIAVPLAWSQDPGMQASQDAMNAAQQASQAAMQANQDAMQANQTAMQQSMDAANSGPTCCGFPLAASPRLSAKTGTYKKPITVRLTDNTWGAVIYYTTDGWTPTSASTRYTGPLTIDSTTLLQAVAIAPQRSGSLIASAVYTFATAPPAPAPVVLPALPANTSSYRIALNVAVPVVFTAPVSSQTAQVGDLVSLKLAEDLTVGDVVLVPKATPVTGRVIQVNHPAMGGLPGEVTFQVESLTLHGTVVPLHASETLAGKPAIHKAMGLAFIPGLGITSLMVHGENAQITPGRVVMATLAAGTLLPAPIG